MNVSGRRAAARTAATRLRVLSTRLVRSSDLPTSGNHFTVPGYRVLGARYATAWARMAKP